MTEVEKITISGEYIDDDTPVYEFTNFLIDRLGLDKKIWHTFNYSFAFDEDGKLFISKANITLGVSLNIEEHLK